MKRIWNLALGTAVLCAALLCGCTFNGSPAPAGSAPADPLPGQELQYPGERVAAVVIDNAPASTTQWGIGSASVVLEALTVNDRPTSLCLAYPSVSAMPTVGPVTLGQDLYLSLIHISEPTRRTPISYAVFCLKKKKSKPVYLKQDEAMNKKDAYRQQQARETA